MHAIQIDDFPHSLITIQAEDFTSKTVLSSMYEPLFYEYKGSYKSDYVKDEYVDETATLNLNFIESYWSNGEQLKASHYYDTLIFILKSNSKYSSYLDFIVGVEEYLFDEISLNEVGIRLVGECLQINTKYKCDYKKILSAVQFSPIYFENGSPTINVTNGRFRFSEISTNCFIEVEHNPYFFKNNVNVVIEKMRFVYINKLYEGVEHYKKGSISMTCSTYFPFDLIKKQEIHTYFHKQISNIFFVLELKPELLGMKDVISYHINKKLPQVEHLADGLNLTSSFHYKSSTRNKFEKLSTFNVEHLNFDEINILLADYYPNDQIMDIVAGIFAESNVRVNIISLPLKEFIKEYNKNNFDICLKLVSPLIKLEIDLLLSYMESLNTEYLKDQYIDLLNEYLELKNESVYIKIQSFLEIHSTIIPIGYANHIYLKNPELNDLYIDENDLYKFCKIK